MKPNELRIGNYVNVANEKQCPFRIDGFQFVSKIDCKVEQYGMPNTHPLTWYFKDIKPIPLTEQWLIRFGFRKTYCEDRENDILCKTIEGDYDFIIEPWYKYGDLVNPNFMAVEYLGQIEIKLEYDHQHQNL